MQIAPVYGDQPLICLPTPQSSMLTLMIEQRDRFGEALMRLEESEWEAPSRCDGWSIADVVTHVVGTNPFWTYSIQAGLRGEPSQLLSTFDPVATPADMVRNAERRTHEELCSALLASNAALETVARTAFDQEWSATAEAPPGHQAVGLVAAHALWDALVHEHDVCDPLGLPVDASVEEYQAAVTYAVALNAASAIVYGTAAPVVCAIEGEGWSSAVAVEGRRVNISLHGAATHEVALSGSNSELLYLASQRAGSLVPELGEFDYLVNGLRLIFDE